MTFVQTANTEPRDSSAPLYTGTAASSVPRSRTCVCRDGDSTSSSPGLTGRRCASAPASYGRGWSLNLVKRVEGREDDLVFSDGSGLAHRFVRHEDGGYVSPAGFYGVIAEVDGITIRFRYGNVLRFDTPADGGRLRSVEDRNGNTITFAHHPDGIEILDSLHRAVAVAITDGMVSEIHDHAGRRVGLPVRR